MGAARCSDVVSVGKWWQDGVVVLVQLAGGGNTGVVGLVQSLDGGSTVVMGFLHSLDG
jgi:hypothetical protein